MFIQKNANTIHHFIKNPRGVFFVLFLLSASLYLLGLIRVGSVLWGDTRYYYAYTRSLVMDGDLDFANEAYRADVGFPHAPVVSDVTGRVTNKFSPGAPIMWIPGFVVGYIVSNFGQMFNDNIVTDGYGLVTQIGVALWSLSFSIVGLYVVFRVVEKLYSPFIARAVTLVLFAMTQLFFYTAIDPLNSHPATFLLSAVLLWQLGEFDAEVKKMFFWKRVVIMGLVAGMLGLVRNQDLIIGGVAGAVLVLSQRSWRDRLLVGVLFALPLMVVVSVQIAIVYHLYGQWGSPYSIQGEVFGWWQPDFWRVLFSRGNGFFTFTPVGIVSVAGLLLALLHRKQWQRWSVALAGLAIFLLQTYLIAVWGPEIVGGPYGSRMFVSSLPWLAVGVAHLLSRFWKTKAYHPWLISLGMVLVINNIVQTVVMLVRF